MYLIFVIVALSILLAILVTFMKKALIVSKTEQSAEQIKALLQSEGYEDFLHTLNFADAKNLIAESVFDLIVINAPIADESGVKTADYAARHTRACVIMIVKEDFANEVSDQMAECGVLVISKPINKHLFHHYLLFTDFFKRRMLGVIEENDKLKQMVEEMKLVNRAKCLLMQCLSMSEAQAHRYLEKQAMDMRMSKIEIAKQVLKTYDY